MKTIGQVAYDAVMLHAFAQGVNELHDNLKVEVSPASNAMPALLDSLIQRAKQLSEDLERIEYDRGPKP